MKIGTWLDAGGAERSGFIEGDRVFALPEGVTVLDLAREGLESTLRRGADVLASGLSIPLSEVTMIVPLRPPAIRDFVAFEEHVEGVVKSVSGEGEVGPEWYQAPTFYFTNPHTLRASGEAIAAPSASEALDFELEVAVVIGASALGEGRDLDAASAHDAVFGYTIFNDWSARDLQRREMKVNLGPCKGKDFASTLGPWIVTADEFEDRHDDEGFLPLAMRVFINGELFGSDLLSNTGWPLAELVMYAARDSQIVPGDLLGSGTAGGGCLAEAWGRAGSQTPRPLRPGDVVRMEVEGIGMIENTIVARDPLPSSPASVAPARVRPRTKPQS